MTKIKPESPLKKLGKTVPPIIPQQYLDVKTYLQWKNNIYIKKLLKSSLNERGYRHKYWLDDNYQDPD